MAGSPSNDQSSSTGGLGGIGIEAVQRSVMGQSGTKSGEETHSSTEQAPHEAAVDKMHPEQVSEYMRDKYMSTTAEEDREDAEMKKN
ncbi:hypothetical protein P7C71_g3912, partial [Lecanoromycetidae sp. Uapishka_2]